MDSNISSEDMIRSLQIARKLLRIYSTENNALVQSWGWNNHNKATVNDKINNMEEAEVYQRLGYILHEKLYNEKNGATMQTKLANIKLKNHESHNAYDKIKKLLELRFRDDLNPYNEKEETALSLFKKLYENICEKFDPKVLGINYIQQSQSQNEIRQNQGHSAQYTNPQIQNQSIAKNPYLQTGSQKIFDQGYDPLGQKNNSSSVPSSNNLQNPYTTAQNQKISQNSNNTSFKVPEQSNEQVPETVQQYSVYFREQLQSALEYTYTGKPGFFFFRTHDKNKSVSELHRKLCKLCNFCQNGTAQALLKKMIDTIKSYANDPNNKLYDTKMKITYKENGKTKTKEIKLKNFVRAGLEKVVEMTKGDLPKETDKNGKEVETNFKTEDRKGKRKKLDDISSYFKMDNTNNGIPYTNEINKQGLNNLAH